MLSGNMLSSNQLLLPDNVHILDLADNPLNELADYEFPHGESLYLDRCQISSMKNIVFNSKYVILNYNPIQIVQNVTFKNAKQVSMRYGGVTLNKFKSFGIRFDNLTFVHLRLNGLGESVHEHEFFIKNKTLC